LDSAISKDSTGLIIDTFDKFCQLEYADNNMISMPHVDSNILDSAKVGVVKFSKFLRLSRSKEFCIAEMASLIDLLKTNVTFC
jgi:hypothetical protein